MTAKQMAHWEKWHRRGRRKFQLTIALLGAIAFGVTKCCLSLARGQPLDWIPNLLLVAFISVGLYFILGKQWDQRIAEYLQQRSSASKDQPGVR
jgi:uncharacterized membrane protein YfcA